MRAAPERFQAALSRLLDTDDLAFIGGFENLLFRQEGGPPRILRVTEGSRRAPAQLEAELHWLGALASRGIPVAAPLPVREDRRVEPLDVDGEAFLVAAFTVAPGRAVDPTDATVWNDALFHRWGALLASLHQAAMAYHPPPGVRRPHWHEEDLVQVDRWLGDEAPAVVTRCRQIVQVLRDRRPTPDTYGLTHSDLHQGNFFVDQGHITAFDFDDTCYHFFVHDLAVALYYGAWFTGLAPAEGEAFQARMREPLLAGYRSIRPISATELAWLPRFMALRDVLLLSVLHKRRGALGDSDSLRDLMARCRARVLAFDG